MSDDSKTDSANLKMLVARKEWAIIKEMVDNIGWLDLKSESMLRWNLSLARLTQLITEKNSQQFVFGSALDEYCGKLHALLKKYVSAEKVFDRSGLAAELSNISRLAMQATAQLMAQFPELEAADLQAAVESRPLAIALSGGGGSGYIFMGALQLLDEEGLIPSALAGNSIGSVVAAFRALSPHLQLDKARELLTQVSRSTLFYRSAQKDNRYTLPGILELHLPTIFADVFSVNNRPITMDELHIPLRVVVAGLSDISASENAAYQDLLDADFSLKTTLPRIMMQLRSLASHRFLPLYLGADDLTRQISVLDAIGISVSIPGLIYHDMAHGDPKMIAIIENLLAEHHVRVLVDGGFVDNMPSEQAGLAIEQSKGKLRDPFILAMDCFVPTIRHMLFLPAMQFVAEKSRQGYNCAHHVVRFRSAISPAKILPSLKDFDYSCAQGKEECASVIPYLKKILSKIPRPYAKKAN